jgi:hypothetical protein
MVWEEIRPYHDQSAIAPQSFVYHRIRGNRLSLKISQLLSATVYRRQPGAAVKKRRFSISHAQRHRNKRTARHSISRISRRDALKSPNFGRYIHTVIKAATKIKMSDFRANDASLTNPEP